MNHTSFVRSFVLISVFTAGILMQGTSGRAETITIPISIDMGSAFYQSINSIFINLSYAVQPSPGHIPLIDDASAVDSPTFMEVDIGQLKLFNSSQSHYAKFITYLTDGNTTQSVNYQSIRWLFSGLPSGIARGTYASEPIGALSPAGAVDLAGYQIDSIGFLLKSYKTFPNNDTETFHRLFEGSGDLIFQITSLPTDPQAATTPEPGTMVLMGIGAAGAAFLRRRAGRTS